MNEPLIRVKQLAYVRVETPDMAKTEKFLDEFGLQVAERVNGKTYLRGTDAEAPCYILSEGQVQSRRLPSKPTASKTFKPFQRYQRHQELKPSMNPRQASAFG